jgi:hypothetical protein
MCDLFERQFQVRGVVLFCGQAALRERGGAYFDRIVRFKKKHDFPETDYANGAKKAGITLATIAPEIGNFFSLRTDAPGAERSHLRLTQAAFAIDIISLYTRVPRKFFRRRNYNDLLTALEEVADCPESMNDHIDMLFALYAEGLVRGWEKVQEKDARITELENQLARRNPKY